MSEYLLMAQTSFRVDDEVPDFVDSRLVPGQNKSIWYRYAVESMMQVDPILDDLYERYQYDERQEFIEMAVKKEVERVKQEGNGYPDT